MKSFSSYNCSKLLNKYAIIRILFYLYINFMLKFLTVSTNFFFYKYVNNNYVYGI